MNFGDLLKKSCRANLFATRWIPTSDKLGLYLITSQQNGLRNVYVFKTNVISCNYPSYEGLFSNSITAGHLKVGFHLAMSSPPKVPPAPRPAATVDALATLRGMGFEELVASASLQAAGGGGLGLGWVGGVGLGWKAWGYGFSDHPNKVPPSEVLTQFAP